MARVVVIGAGLGGLAAAAHLLGDGHEVTIIERDERPGGRAGLIERDGFRLDNGPTVLTMPAAGERAFAATAWMPCAASAPTIAPSSPATRPRAASAPTKKPTTAIAITISGANDKSA